MVYCGVREAPCLFLLQLEQSMCPLNHLSKDNTGCRMNMKPSLSMQKLGRGHNGDTLLCSFYFSFPARQYIDKASQEIHCVMEPFNVEHT